MRKIYIVIFVLLLFIVDRITKLLAFKFLINGLFCSKNIIGLKLFLNKGIAFGIPIPQIFSIVATSIIIIILINLLIKARINILADLIIIMGAFSNFLDRAYYGGVIDFITIKYMPIFNLADIYIIFGLLISIYSLKRINKQTMRKNTTE